MCLLGLLQPQTLRFGFVLKTLIFLLIYSKTEAHGRNRGDGSARTYKHSDRISRYSGENHVDFLWILRGVFIAFVALAKSRDITVTKSRDQIVF